MIVLSHIEFYIFLLFYSLVAGQIMGDNVIFFRPVEKVGTVVDVLKSCGHSTFPVVDTEDNENILFGTIFRHEICALLKNRAFGRPTSVSSSSSLVSDYIHVNGKELILRRLREGRSFPTTAQLSSLDISLHDFPQ